MTILATDIKLLESENMDDTVDGGGRRTSRVIVDGEAGNIFPKVSRLDTTYGRFNLRKVYGGIMTANADLYAGAHAVILDAPDDPNMAALMFAQNSDSEKRSAAVARIESFYTASGDDLYYGWFGADGTDGDGMIQQGSTTLKLMSIGAAAKTPLVGDVFMMSGTTPLEVFHVTSVVSVQGPFVGWGGWPVYTQSYYQYELTIAYPARQTFAENYTVRKCTPSNAVVFYGIRPLAAQAAQDATSVVVDSVTDYLCDNANRDESIIGLDPHWLPVDGRAPIYRVNDVCVVHNTQDTALANPAVAGAVYNVGRTDLAEIWLVDHAGVRVDAGQYAVDLATGAVTMAASLNLAGYAQPLVARHRIEDMVLLSAVNSNGTLTLADPLPRAYPVGTSYVSSALVFGDLFADVSNLHDLTAFSTWSDTPGSPASATYNDLDYPIQVTNAGAVTERWRINFTSSTAFQVIGEVLGTIATGTTTADCSPSNPLTGQPYFSLSAAGWGSGWAAGNNLRFNTADASPGFWLTRAVLHGAGLEGDALTVQLRGDVDAV